VSVPSQPSKSEICSFAYLGMTYSTIPLLLLHPSSTRPSDQVPLPCQVQECARQAFTALLSRQRSFSGPYRRAREFTRGASFIIAALRVVIARFCHIRPQSSRTVTPAVRNHVALRRGQLCTYPKARWRIASCCVRAVHARLEGSLLPRC
jgi:hypothetical protein